MFLKERGREVRGYSLEEEEEAAGALLLKRTREKWKEIHANQPREKPV